MPSTISIAMSMVAAILYALTYLSFTYLLRYPRNWVMPSVPATLSCGTLFCTMIAAVSISANGIDIKALIASSILVPPLFYIVAAPAIAFKPASRPTEFVAKHGAQSELMLLGLAILAFLAIDNTQLRTVIFIAIIIELAWFLREWNGLQLREVHCLNDADLSVLRTQANGDLRKFKQAHNIRELNISSDRASWIGCGKQTPACPFNLYVNRLGLNTAPCCREHMKKLIKHIVDGLEKIGAVHWLEGGTLLGAVRENGSLLDWEDDVDISVLLTDELTWEELTAGLVNHGAIEGFYVDVFPRKGFISISFDQPRPFPLRWERNRMRGEIRADIAVYRQAISHGQTVLERRSKKGDMPPTQNGAYGVPEDVVLPTIGIDFIDGRFAAPNQPELYLKLLYGDFQNVEYTYIDPAAALARGGGLGA